METKATFTEKLQIFDSLTKKDFRWWFFFLIVLGFCVAGYQLRRTEEMLELRDQRIDALHAEIQNTLQVQLVETRIALSKNSDALVRLEEALRTHQTTINKLK